MIDPKIAEETKRFVEARDSYRADNPQVIGAFLDMKKEAFKPGSLDVATKYLMAVLMGVARGSGRCVLTHVPTAVDAGVSRQQLMEALNVSIVFGGAP
jgi:AhpD family alkylhydroperoxidase